MRARLVYEVYQIGMLLASPRVECTSHGDGTATVRVTFACWYWPVMALALWIAGA